MKTRRPTAPLPPPAERLRVSRRGFLGVAAGAAGVTTLVATQLARADAEKVEAERLPVYGEKTVKAVCQQCVGGCGLLVRTLGDEVIGLAGNPQHPANRGGLCARAFGALELLGAKSRVEGPMVKDGARGKLKRATWDEALGLVTARLADLAARGQAHTLAVVGGQYRGTRDQVLARFARAYGTPNYLRLRSFAPEQPALAHRFMQGATAPMAWDLAEARLVVSFGAELVESWLNPVHTARALTQLRRAEEHRRGRLIHIDARRSPTAIKADRWVGLVPGTEGILALGLANVLIREQLYEEAFVAEHTLGFEDWVEADGTRREGFKALVLRDYGLLAVSEATGVPVDTILQVGRELGGARPAVVIGEPEAAYGPDDLRTRMAIHALNALVGSLGVRGGVLPQAPLPLAAFPEPPPDAAAEASLAQPRLDGAGRGDYLLAADAPQALPARIRAGAPYPVNALFMVGTNPPASSPSGAELMRALENVPFVVSFSPFLDETTAHADVVLPDALFLERWHDDVLTHLAGFTCYSLGAPSTPPRRDARDAGDVFLALAAALGQRTASALPFKNFEQAVRHVARGLFEARRGHLAAAMADESLHRTLERQGYWTPEFSDFDGFFTALTERGAWYDLTSLPVGRKALFKTASGKFELHAPALGVLLDEAARREGGAGATGALLRPVAGQPVLPAVAYPTVKAVDAFPLWLDVYELATTPLGGAHDQRWLLEQPAAHVQASWGSWVELHPRLAHQLGVEDGHDVLVESPKGQLRLSARVSGGGREDVVHVPTYGGPGANPFELIADAPDLFHGFGLLGTTRVRIRRA